MGGRGGEEEEIYTPLFRRRRCLFEGGKQKEEREKGRPLAGRPRQAERPTQLLGGDRRPVFEPLTVNRSNTTLLSENLVQ